MESSIFFDQFRRAARDARVVCLCQSDPYNPPPFNWNAQGHWTKMKFEETSIYANCESLIKFFVYIMVNGEGLGHTDIVVYMDENKDIVAIQFAHCKELFYDIVSRTQMVYGFPIKEIKRSNERDAYIVIFQ